MSGKFGEFEKSWSEKRRESMDKSRHPHVVRTWTVERTKVPYRQAQPVNLRPRNEKMRGPAKQGRGVRPEPGDRHT
jgi:hypothetical protein